MRSKSVCKYKMRLKSTEKVRTLYTPRIHLTSFFEFDMIFYFFHSICFVHSSLCRLACAPMVETRFLELAIFLLDFSSGIPLGTFSVLLRKQRAVVKWLSSGLAEQEVWVVSQLRFQILGIPCFQFAISLGCSFIRFLFATKS